VLHLLYSRFWHKVLFDRGHVSTREPFQRLVNQGMILGWVYYAHKDPTNQSYVSYETLSADQATSRERIYQSEVEERDARFYLKGTDTQLEAVTEKMSKARGNVVNPDDVVNHYGADSLRLYEMFMGPLEAVKPWSMQGVEGVYRFLSRVWRLFIDANAETVKLAATVQDIAPDRETQRKLHQTIQKVTDDLDGLRFNTAIAAMMELTNHLTALSVRPRSVLETLTLLLAPFAPHIAEELWHALGHKDTLAYAPWPKSDPALLQVDEVEIVIQINSKPRSRLMVAPNVTKEAMEKLAMDDTKVKELTAGKTIKKVVVIPGKMVNIVVG
jgi:leucyl-tRNA synthetase